MIEMVLKRPSRKSIINTRTCHEIAKNELAKIDLVKNILGVEISIVSWPKYADENK